MAHTTLTKLLLGGAMLTTLTALTACGEPEDPTPNDCDPAQEADPDCLLDGECNTADAEDPDCEACDYTPDAEECQPDPCDEPNPPPECNPFVPDRVSVSYTLAYDAEANIGRSFFVEGTEVPPSLSMLIQDAKLETTNNLAFACNIELTSNAGYNPEGAPNSFEVASPAQTLDHYGVVWTQGNYSFADAPYQASAGTVEGCSGKYMDPAIYGDDFTALLADRNWGAGWGTMETQIEGFMNDEQGDDPANDYDLYDLHQNGYICGGSQLAGENTTGYLISFAFDVDTDTWAQIPSGNEDDPNERLPCTAMEVDGETGKPASGIYLSRSYGYWNAPFLLGLQ